MEVREVLMPEHDQPSGPLDPVVQEKILELRERHRTLDKRLKELDTQISLTSEEQLERKRIQKMKLLCKDQIALLMLQG